MTYRSLSPPRTIARKLRYIAAIQIICGTQAALAEQQFACPKRTEVTVVADEALGAGISSYELARSEAVRQALIRAIGQATGVEVATSFTSVDTSSTTRVTTESTRKTAMRSAGRAMKWDVVEEVVVEDGDGNKWLHVVMNVTVCLEPHQDMPAIVAFAPIQTLAELGPTDLRAVMSTSFPSSDRYEITLKPPKDTYYDILISGNVLAVDVTMIDNRGKIETLRNYLSEGMVERIPEHVQRVTVRVMARAETFAGRPVSIAVSELVENIPFNAELGAVRKELIREAFANSVAALYEKLPQ